MIKRNNTHHFTVGTLKFVSVYEATQREFLAQGLKLFVTPSVYARFFSLLTFTIVDENENLSFPLIL